MRQDYCLTHRLQPHTAYPQWLVHTARPHPPVHKPSTPPVQPPPAEASPIFCNTVMSDMLISHSLLTPDAPRFMLDARGDSLSSTSSPSLPTCKRWGARQVMRRQKGEGGQKVGGGSGH